MSPTPSTIVEKLVAGLALAFAFVVMASIFTPAPSVADGNGHGQGAAHGSTNPHEGLAMLGSLEGGRYIIRIYGTDVGPRYSVYDAPTGEELSVLITAERIAEWYPEINLPAIQFDSAGHIMLADPEPEILNR
jgi:hypothetical protein